MCFSEVFENQGYIVEPFFAFLKGQQKCIMGKSLCMGVFFKFLKGHDFSKEIAKIPPKIKKNSKRNHQISIYGSRR